MGLRTLIALITVASVSMLALEGCSKSAQKIQPDTRGKRGESCLARNDCDTGLACINNTCVKNEFAVKVTANECARVECEETTDCCGDKLTEVPTKCATKDETCDSANRLLQGCVATTCTSDANCGGGSCKTGICSGGGNAATPCETVADCLRDTCVIPVEATIGTCTVSGVSCTSDATCPYYASTVTCANRTCDCTNPAYNPNAEICTDPDCEDICLLRCESQLCVQDHSCKTAADCASIGLTACVGGRCVECTKNSECDTDNDETCEDNVCHKPCTENEECPLFHACKKGDCVYAGCNDDRECILAAARGQAVGGDDNAAAAVSGGDDPRLFKCLQDDNNPDYKTCKVPCENDGSCGQFQVCDGGYCKFVGCETDEQCRDYLGLANQMTSDAKPFIAKAKCVEPEESTK